MTSHIAPRYSHVHLSHNGAWICHCPDCRQFGAPGPSASMVELSAAADGTLTMRQRCHTHRVPLVAAKTEVLSSIKSFSSRDCCTCATQHLIRVLALIGLQTLQGEIQNSKCAVYNFVEDSDG